MKNLSVRVKMILLALITLVGTLAIVLLAETHISEMEKDSEMNRTMMRISRIRLTVRFLF